MSTVMNKNLTQEIIESFSADTYTEANDLRKQAIGYLETLGLPTNKSEEYRFTPITKHLEKNFKWENKNPQSSINSIDDYLIPELDANIFVFINGSFSQKYSKVISPQDQVVIKTLAEGFQSESKTMLSYFDKVGSSQNDPFAAMNSAFWQEGVCINIPDKTIVEKPIFLLHINDTTLSQVIAHTRLLLIIGQQSEASIIEKFETTGGEASFHTFIEEILVSESASLNYYKIQNDKGAACQVTNSAIQQLSGSKVSAFTLTLNGQLIRNNFSITIDGEHCESHFNGLYLLKGKTLVDNHTVVDHKKPNSQSNELYKGIMDGNSKGVFNGKIFVRPHAQKTNAFQSNRNILICDDATINTKPQLEIWADDVKCSHGCTTGQLDEEALFYLQSRGISKQSAQAILLYAFAADVVATIPHGSIKNYFDLLISERLQKNF
jgi:Fe-S cluster assembly protein SufD